MGKGDQKGTFRNADQIYSEEMVGISESKCREKEKERERERGVCKKRKQRW